MDNGGTTSLEKLLQIEQERSECTEHSQWSPDRNCIGCAKRDRNYIKHLRDLAKDNVNVFSYVYIMSYDKLTDWVIGFFLLFIAVVVEAVIPLTIVVTMQPIDRAELDTVCPNRPDPFTKFLALTLALFFAVLTLFACNGKLRGLNFLQFFVRLGNKRRVVLLAGIVSQVVAILGASGAQFLLFMSVDSYVGLLFSSVAMQFTLSVDTRLLSNSLGSWTTNRIDKLSEDHLLCDGLGVGGPEEPIPAETAKYVLLMKRMNIIFLSLLVAFTVCLAILVAVCI